MVQERITATDSWEPCATQLTRTLAEETALVLHQLRPALRRLFNDDGNGEVVRLSDGKPLPLDLMRRDFRTLEQVMADVAGDRYEASLEQGADL